MDSIPSTISSSVPPIGRASLAPRAWLASLPRLELGAFAVGVVVRVLAGIGFRPSWGFDFPFHLQYVTWVSEHWTRPDIYLNAAAYHGPLYYFLAAALVRLGATARVVQQLSIACGIVRLGILWWGLRRFLPQWPRARVLALALAAVLPAAVQLDSQVSNEALGTTLAAIAILALPGACAQQPRPRDVIWFCAWLGLAVVTKVSYLLVGVVALPFAARTLWRQRSWRALRPWLAGGVVFVALTSPLFAVNAHRYGKLIVTAYDGPLRRWQAPRERVPYFDRRTLGFYVAWDSKIWKDPYYPTACCSSSRFFPVLVAATFGDYLNYGYGPPTPPAELPLAPVRNHRPVAPTTMRLSRLSVAAGSFIALVVAAGAWILGRRLWRAGDPRLVLILLPIVGVLGQVHFATSFPADTDGPVKGTYIQFAMLPAFAIVGVVFEALSRGRAPWQRGLAGLIALGVVAVAAYTLAMKIGTIALG